MSDHEVLCLGEAMVLVAPRPGQPLATARDATLSVAGAESNVARYLADLGHRVAWASRVGSDPLGDRVLTAVARPGVDVRHVERDPSAPTGVYFKDPSGEGGTRVHYYRTGSAASRLTPAYLDTLPVAAARLVHLSGITAALSALLRPYRYGPVRPRTRGRGPPLVRRQLPSGALEYRRGLRAAARPGPAGRHRVRRARRGGTGLGHHNRSAEAVLDLVRPSGATVVGLAVLIELRFLKGRERLAPALGGAPLTALLPM